MAAAVGACRATQPLPSARGLSKRVSVIARARYIGIDYGTSGARAAVIDDNANITAEASTSYGSASSLDEAWRSALWRLMDALPAEQRAQAASIAIDGTSATTLLVDGDTGEVLAPPRMYNAAQPAEAVARARALAPPDHTATASTSTLCKVLAWDGEGAWQVAAAAGRSPAFVHQADWVAGLLHGQWRVTDYNNALKLGFDPAEERYPEWLAEQPFASLLPLAVVAPGAPVAPVTPEAAARAGLPEGCLVCGGTTDSIAAFVAAGVTEPGEAVTSLGSTLAIKLLSTTRVDDARYGLYSHRLGGAWLVGGASNTGGAVLRRFFSDAQLAELTPRMDASRPTGLDYYPLTAPGERFPVNDPGLQPRLEPRPADDAVFLQGILESVARIEAQAYRLLAEQGATPVTRVLTAGGGAKNPVWTELRQRELGVPVSASLQAEAAYGSALLAKRGAALAAPSPTALVM
ncbi:hypothetical protein ABPG75_007801 [Micractinium tetrahymenae]